MSIFEINTESFSLRGKCVQEDILIYNSLINHSIYFPYKNR